MTIPLARLDWDSSFFGLKTGRTSGAGNTDIREALQTAREEKFQLIYAYSETPLSQELLDEFSGLDVGGQVTFSKVIGDPPATQASDHTIRRYEGKEPTQSMLELALLSGHLSRFLTDSRLPAGCYERMYERWLRNSLGAGDSAAVYISRTRTNAVGLITATHVGNQSNIGLLAVSQAAQGQGIGRRLLQEVELESHRRNAMTVQVRTQAVNSKALGLYAKAGYKETERTWLYHFLLHKSP